ncbi:hypothetical protein WA026_005280 [Henosepilachna vigintioctopunctata]|uniref:Endonuclease/exonuclease/phosphatase domain-containing protein n=1 Tax=Henosepilachna vigintioctopunctata TaxID=420089 RepID=A0AAW1UWK5_9CUCU
MYTSHGLSIEEVSLSYPDLDMFICGDYNIPSARWINDNFFLCEDTSLASLFRDSADFVNISQVNNISNSRGVFLDLIFVRGGPIRVSRAIDLLQSNSIHHYGLQFSIELNKLDSEKLLFQESRFDFHRGDYAGLNEFFPAAIGIVLRKILI